MRLKDFFYFNRSDRLVIIVFLVVASVTVLLFTVWNGTDNSGIRGEESAVGQVSKAKYPVGHHPPRYYAQPLTQRAERFPFDPNTADSTMLLRLGLQPWQVRNVYRYRAAGGVYRTPEDFARVYGLTLKQYRELRPYIHISEDYMPAAEHYPREEHPRRDSLRRHANKLSPGMYVDLNTADTTQLMQVPGIGPYFARRIVRYRERLGGYVRVEQLSEIEDFPTSAMSFLKLSGEIRKIKINIATLSELKHHPYINYYQAKAIVTYRRLKGDIPDMQVFKLVPDFTPEDLERIAPYMDFGTR